MGQSAASSPCFVVSCEHAGNRIPPEFVVAFAVPSDVLASHRGHDPGSEAIGRDLAAALGAPLVVNRVTRLLVDANRSRRNPRRFSEYARALGPELCARAAETVWEPHRAAVAAAIDGAERRPVVHIASHTFTPVWEGVPRTVDVGVLYDPARAGERGLAGRWIGALRAARPDLRVRRNAPYRGVADGLPTELRQSRADADYVGIELEVSQSFPLAGGAAWDLLRRDLVATLLGALEPARQ